MENASKALIIAGAILLSILIISLGIMVFNGARGTAQRSNLDSTEVDAFNSGFLQYTGGSVSARNVEALLRKVMQSNIDENRNQTNKFVVVGFQNYGGSKVFYGGSAAVTATPTTYVAISSIPTVSSGRNYKVEPKNDPATGLICYIDITPAT